LAVVCLFVRDAGCSFSFLEKQKSDCD